MSCRSGCPTQDHGSWGECARAANLLVAPSIQQIPSRKAWDSELKLYAEARRQGLQPKGTRTSQTMAAIKAADAG